MDLRRPRTLSLLIPLLMAALLAGCSPTTTPSATVPASAPPAGGSVISTGASTNQMVSTLPQAVADQWNALQAAGKGVE